MPGGTVAKIETRQSRSQPLPLSPGAARIPRKATGKLARFLRQPAALAYPSGVRTRIHTLFWSPYLP